MLLIAILLLGGSATVSALLTVLLGRAAPRLGLMDVPGAGHKQHARAIPLAGGPAIFVAVALVLLGSAGLVSLLGRWQPSFLPAVVAENLPGLQAKMPSALLLLAGAAGVFLLGLIDDYRPLGPWIKLAGQLAVTTAVVVLLQVRAAVFLPSGVSAVVTVLWIVAIINAINFMDNMDGLAGGVVVLCGLIFTATAAVNGQLFVPALLLVVVGATAGFLLFNFPPARVFMGNSGSHLLGYFLGVLTVLTTYTKQFESHRHAVLVPLIILAVPLYDLLSVCLVRLAQGRNPLRGDRSHFSHRLLGRGMTTRAAVGTVYLAVVATGLAAVFLLRLPARLAWIVFVQTLCIVGIIAILEFRWPQRNGNRRP